MPDESMGGGGGGGVFFTRLCFSIPHAVSRDIGFKHDHTGIAKE